MLTAVEQRRQKIDGIDIFVYDEFENTRQQFLCVHDIDLRRWALKKARELNLKDFEASDKWLLNFKRFHRISSRQITQLVTRKHVESRKEIERAKSFVFEIDKILEKYIPEEVLNSDQVGINLEVVRHRTLTYVGKQSTWGSVRSVSNTSHSYTI